MASLELIAQVENWLEILERANYYELLGILEIADEGAIQRAFHDFSVNFHPDRYRGEPDALVHAITKIYQRGAEAYGVLRDPKTRAKYDIALSQGALRYTPGRTQHDNATATDQELAASATTRGGQLHARQAERALSEGDIDLAQHLIDKALLAEGDNPEFSRRADELLLLVRSGRILPQ